jgi:quinohemoprotein ethanol dehydrogenase
VVNWTTGIDMKTGRPNYSEQGDYSESPKIVWPSVAGGHSWHPMSFSPRTGLVYLPVTEAPMRLETIAPQPRLPGTHFHLKVQFPPFNNPGDEGLLKGKPAVKVESRLKAWDPVQQKVVWQSAAMPFISGGSLVSGDLVFQGASDGYFRAFNAKTGEVLKELFVGTSIMAAPISYKVDGIQYIAVMAGGGGPRGARFGEDEAGYAYENYERLLVFKLGGESVPLPPKRSQPALPPVPEAIAASAETLAHGEALYKEHCQRCHILGGAIGNYPNLWHMRPETTGAFEAIVGQGVFKYAGMDNFSNVLSADDIHAIKAFIINDTIAKREGDQGATSNTAYH